MSSPDRASRSVDGGDGFDDLIRATRDRATAHKAALAAAALADPVSGAAEQPQAAEPAADAAGGETPAEAVQAGQLQAAAEVERCAAAATPDASRAAADVNGGLVVSETAQERSSPAEKTPELLQVQVQGINQNSVNAGGGGRRDPMCCTQGRSPLHSGYYSDYYSDGLESPMSPAV